MNETIAVIGGAILLIVFGYGIAVILLGIFRAEPRYEARPRRVTPPCGPDCGDYHFTGWTAEQVQEWHETRHAPASRRGLLPERDAAGLPAGLQAGALPAGAAQKALPEGQKDEPIEILTRQGKWIEVRR